MEKCRHFCLGQTVIESSSCFVNSIFLNNSRSSSRGPYYYSLGVCCSTQKAIQYHFQHVRCETFQGQFDLKVERFIWFNSVGLAFSSIWYSSVREVMMQFLLSFYEHLNEFVRTVNVPFLSNKRWFDTHFDIFQNWINWFCLKLRGCVLTRGFPIDRLLSTRSQRTVPSRPRRVGGFVRLCVSV